MKLAVSASGRTLDDPVDARFGRCPVFLIVDSDSMSFEVLENPNIGARGGAGVQSAQLVAGSKVEAVLTGNCGPKAFQTLQAAGIKVVVGINGSVRQAVEQYKAGKISPAARANVMSHFNPGSKT